MSRANKSNHYVSINPRDTQAYYPVKHNGNDKFVYDIKVLGAQKKLELTECIATYFDGLDKIYE